MDLNDKKKMIEFSLKRGKNFFWKCFLPSQWVKLPKKNNNGFFSQDAFKNLCSLAQFGV